MTNTVRDNAAQHRFELEVEGHMATLYYRLEPGVITLVHTEVPEALGGRGVGSTLVRGALEAIRAKGLKLVVKCPFVAAYMGKHPEFNDLVK
jgi:predicted GNAT family acetyltransferase